MTLNVEKCAHLSPGLIVLPLFGTRSPVSVRDMRRSEEHESIGICQKALR